MIETVLRFEPDGDPATLTAVDPRITASIDQVEVVELEADGVDTRLELDMPLFDLGSA